MLRLVKALTDEEWVCVPGEEILPGYEVSFAARARGMMNGVEGKVVYDVEVPDGGPVCSALHLTFEVPVLGYNSVTKRAPQYLTVRLDKTGGSHPHFQLLVLDNDTDAATEVRAKEVRRYVQQQAAGFERMRRQMPPMTTVAPQGLPNAITVQGVPVSHAPIGTTVVNASLGGLVHPEAVTGVEPAQHLVAMQETTALLGDMLATNAVLTQAEAAKLLIADARRLIQLLPGMVQRVPPNQEDLINDLLTANDRLEEATQECAGVLAR